MTNKQWQTLFPTLLGFAGLMGVLACKDPVQPPAPTPSPTPNPFAATQPTPTPEPEDSRCSNENFQCNVAQDLVDLCLEEEEDTSKCNNDVWPKTLWDKMVAIQAGEDDPELTDCNTSILYVNTQNDPLALREKPDKTSTLLADVPRAQGVTCLGISKDDTDWAKVKTNDNKEGWMFMRYLHQQQPSGSPSGSTAGTEGGDPKAPDGVTRRCKYWEKEPREKRLGGQRVFVGAKCHDKNNDPYREFGVIDTGQKQWNDCIVENDSTFNYTCACHIYVAKYDQLTHAECMKKTNEFYKAEWL